MNMSRISKKVSRMVEIFEKNEFSVNLFKSDGTQYAEIMTWTAGGVNMIHNFTPVTVEAFEKIVEDFDVDEEIDIHRQDQRYKDAFSIRQSVEDFEKYHNKLKEVLEELKQEKEI